MMSDMEKYEMHALREELKKAIENLVEQEIEIMRLKIRVNSLRILCNAGASETTESVYGSLKFSRIHRSLAEYPALLPEDVADALVVAIDKNIHDIRSKIKEVL